MQITQYNMVTGEAVIREMTAEEIAALPTQDAVAPDPVLSQSQWRFFLNLTGFGKVIADTLDAMPKATIEQRAAWAALDAVANASPSYTLPTTIALAAKFGGAGVPSEADIRQAWAMAAQFQGAASIAGAA